VKAGDLSLTRLEIKMGAGEIIADLTGDWKRISTPTYGVALGMRSSCCRRTWAYGFMPRRDWFNQRGQAQTRGDEYSNDLYGKSPVTLRLDVSAG